LLVPCYLNSSFILDTALRGDVDSSEDDRDMEHQIDVADQNTSIKSEATGDWALRELVSNRGKQFRNISTGKNSFPFPVPRAERK
jgi:hypothetical protein